MTKLVTNSNLVYVKEYKNNYMYQGYINPSSKLPNGLGRIKYLESDSNIDIYEGNFIDGEGDGYGIIIYKDSNIYKGQIKNSKRNGFGTMYSSNGLFLYDGSWIDDNLNRPMYHKVINNGILNFQGFKFNDQYNGWCVEHNPSNGLIINISYYNNDIPIKGFDIIYDVFLMSNPNRESDIIKTSYLVNRCKENNRKLLPIFIANLIIELSKEDNLIIFLSEKKNIEMLEDISFYYDIKENLDSNDHKFNKKMVKNSSYIICNDYEFIEENIFIEDKNIKVLYLIDEIIIGEYNSEENIFTNAYKYSKSSQEYIYNILIKNINSNIEYSIDNPNLSIFQGGKFIQQFNNWVLNGEGWKKKMAYILQGNFLNGLITDGIESNDNDIIFKGTYREDETYKNGSIYYENGLLKYQGDFYNNKQHGNGSSYYTNNNIEAIEYIGEWYNGCKEGYGTLFTVGGDEIYSGQFIDDQIA